MPDVREQILARLVEVAASAPGVALAGRNQVSLSETARPAVIVLDADETAEEEERGGQRSLPHFRYRDLAESRPGRELPARLPIPSLRTERHQA